MERLLRRIIDANIRFALDLQEDIAYVHADPGQVEQVIMNLVINANDAMADGGTISIESRLVQLHEDDCPDIPDSRPGEFVRVCVSDTGTGMTPEVLKHIFEPFYSTKAEGKGTGLGLSVVCGIIKQHKGWINADSKPGMGTHMTFFLPALARIQYDEVSETRNSSSIPRGCGELIPLVEDQHEVRRFAAAALRDHGYAVLEAGDVDEALAVFRNEKKNMQLVFSDVVLPGRNALAMIDCMLSGRPGLPLILTSGYTDHRAQWIDIQKRGFRFLPKPYSLLDLISKVSETLQSVAKP